MSGRGNKKKKPFMGTDYPPFSESIPKAMKQREPKPLPIITARSKAQKVYLNKLGKQQHDILMATGPAGTGKTYLAVLHAIKLLRAGDIDKISITRPNVGAGDDLGFLPGTLIEKMGPWIQPIMDVFKEVYEVHEVEQMLRSETIEIVPLVYMRGRTLKNTFVIADEMQNATPEQMKMLLTRIGENSMMVITGDLEQHDRGNAVSGLFDFIARWKTHLAKLEDAIPPAIQGDADDIFVDASPAGERIGYVNFRRCDVVRHPVIEEVLNIYG
jgi:phosphate starvation-inducible protein PhoH